MNLRLEKIWGQATLTYHPVFLRCRFKPSVMPDCAMRQSLKRDLNVVVPIITLIIAGEKRIILPVSFFL